MFNLENYMGRFIKGIEKLLEAQKKSIEEEAERSGVEIVSFEEVVPSGDKTSGALKSTLKLLFGGKAKTTVFQTYQLKRGDLTATLYQPYEGLSTLAGEFHALIDSTFDSPFSLVKGSLFGVKWISENNFEDLLKSDKNLMKAAKSLKWVWAAGFTKITHKWAVQITNVGNSHSHVVHQGARYGGFTTYHVGINQYFNFLEALTQSPRKSSSDPQPQNPHNSTQFGKIFFSQENS
jgi:hypothetical protein